MLTFKRSKRPERLNIAVLAILVFLGLPAWGQDSDETPPDPSDTLATQDNPEQPAPEAKAPRPAIDEKELLPILMDFARSDRPDLQEQALLKAQTLLHPFLLSQIRYLAREATVEVRIVACETLALYRNVQGLHELKLAIYDSHQPLALRAIQLLAEFPLPVIRQELVDVIRGPDYSQELKEQAIASLHAMGTPEAQKALQDLIPSLPAQLAELARQPAIEPHASEPKRLLLLRRLFTREHLKGRLQAAAMIGETFDSGEARDIISTCLKDPERSLKLEALKQAEKLHPADFESILTEALSIQESAMIQPWLRLTQKLDPERSIPLLLKALADDQPKRLREGALQALSQPGAYLESPAVTDAIIKLFEESRTDASRLAIAKALSLRPAEKAFLPLRKTFGQKNMDERIRLIALTTLITREPKDLVPTLMDVARNEPSLDLRKKAAAEIVTNHCEELGETCLEFDYHYPTEAAAGLFYTTAGALGASSLGLLSQVAGGNQPFIAALSGAVLGSGTAYMLAPDEGITHPEAFHFTSLGLWGSALGYGIGATAIDGLEKPAFTWTFLGGQLFGATLGALSFKDTTATASDFALMHWSGIEATSATLGAMTIWGKEDPTDYERQMGPAIATLVGLGVGVAPMWFLASDLEFSTTDPALIALTTLAGAGLGNLGARAASDRKTAGVGGALMGQGLGYLGGLIASQYTDFTPGELTWVSLSGLSGSAMGLGLAIASDKESKDSALWGSFIGGLTLSTAAALTSEHFNLRWNDSDMALVGTLVGATLGVTAPMISGDTDFSASGGIFGASAGFLGGLAYDHMHPVELRNSSLALLGAVAGSAMGAGFTLILPETGNVQTTGALVSTLTLAGFSSMLWAAPNLAFSEGDYLLTFGSMATAGLIGGLSSGIIYGDEETASQTLGGSLIGTTMGLGIGLVASQFSNQKTPDIAETLLITSMGTLLGRGIASLTPEDSLGTRGNRILTTVGTGLGLAAGTLLAPHTSYTAEDYWLTSYLTLYGSFHGAWLPGLWTQEADDHGFGRLASGGAMLGSVLGATSGMLLSHYETFTFDDINEMALGSLASSIFGAGIGLMVPVDNGEDMRPWVAGMQVGGILGTAAVSLMAPHTDFSQGDTTLGFLATAYGAWQGAGASLLLDGTGRQVAGAVLATTALGAAGGAAISQHVDASTDELFAAFSGSVWGAWLGGMGAVALQKEFDVELSNKELLGSFFVASDIGLLVTAAAMSPLMDMDPERVGWINLYGLSGMALGSALGAIFPDVPFWTSNVSASAVGLIVGAVVTSFVDMPVIIEDTPAVTWDDTEIDEQPRAFHYPGQIVAILPQFQVTPITTPDGHVMAEGNRFVLGVMGLWD